MSSYASWVQNDVNQFGLYPKLDRLRPPFPLVRKDQGLVDSTSFINFISIVSVILSDY